MSDQATFKLDGQDIPFQPGQTIMQAAQDAGAYIPHLCHHRDFAPIGSCKVCSVRIKGRMVASCTMPASAGLEVESETADINADRQRLIQMLFVEGNHHCPFCEKSGNCHLQALGYHLGMQDTHFVHAYPQHPVDASHPDVLLDRSRCVLCELCVRASREVDGKDVFAIGGRGLKTELLINSPSGQLKDSAIAASDRAMSICPVGALMPKRHGFVIPIGQRPYDHVDISQKPEDS
ncbi:MAG: 2Fe-2S iron-sulfur cluster binding domain-containing protein [Aquabacterium sp.]|uniref:2Fe-2S iron-sulfur cluster-binding protein n=1 Tax=Aquabacterium sp. TaxID=1872578 RepID=UPI00121B80AA|nr:2Fe-2S iron-sulfur cluster-binding protein [Aquabacterium sp.]TAK93335.1 MAG: 2Fe-2S iron-sulfur cluster binding domain-containing protein [Aquabacterium sp.]